MKTSNQYIKFVEPEFVYSDNRGFLTQLFSKKKWSQVNFIKSNAKSIRGNHYHQFNRELFYVIDGCFSLTLEINNQKIIYNMVKGDMFIIEAEVKHSFEYINETLLISMYDNGVELENGKLDLIT